jgi:hypothetical protein
MSTEERDTHFKNAARLLYQRLSDLNGGYETIISEDLNEQEQQEQLQIIAQFAYDLALHVLRRGEDYNHNFGLDKRALLASIPDLTEWPPE